jgi:hypothetical protein
VCVCVCERERERESVCVFVFTLLTNITLSPKKLARNLCLLCHAIDKRDRKSFVTLTPDDSSKDGLRQRDVSVGVNVGAFTAEVVGLLHPNRHKKFLKFNDRLGNL